MREKCDDRSDYVDIVIFENMARAQLSVSAGQGRGRDFSIRSWKV